MVESKSADIRRFFDLLGSIFCVLLFGFGIWQDIFRNRPAHRFLFLALLIIVGLSVYLSFHKLVWRYLNTRFIYGYANFFVISSLGASVAAGLAIMLKVLIINPTAAAVFNQLEFVILQTSAANVLFFYWAISLPMAFFWLVGILTAWKFSKCRYLP